MLNIDYQTAMNQGGATGLSYSQTTGRDLGEPRSPISRGGDGRTVSTDRTVSTNRDPLTRSGDGRTVSTERTIGNQRPPLSRDESSRAFYNEPVPRTIAGLRERIQRTDNGRMVELASTNQNNNAGQVPANNQNKTPLDFRIEDLFRGFYGEPIRGRGETGGEFLYVPAATNSGSSGGMLVLLVAGAGVLGYFAYRKFAGG